MLLHATIFKVKIRETMLEIEQSNHVQQFEFNYDFTKIVKLVERVREFKGNEMPLDLFTF